MAVPTPSDYWKCNEGTGTSLAPTIGSDTLTAQVDAWESGAAGQSLTFNGTTQHATNGSPTTGAVKTISAWVKFTEALDKDITTQCLMTVRGANATTDYYVIAIGHWIGTLTNEIVTLLADTGAVHQTAGCVFVHVASGVVRVGRDGRAGAIRNVGHGAFEHHAGNGLLAGQMHPGKQGLLDGDQAV